MDTFSTWCAFDLLKADNPNGGDSEPMSARIGGVISSAARDFQGEELSQNGVDWDYFLKHGWFNYEHKQGPENVLGHPESVTPMVYKGKPATRVEGVLYLSTSRGKEIYDTAQAMQKAGTKRRLGFSVEGQVLARDKKKILKARVLNVAITAHPVNPDARLEVLAKAATGIGYQTPAGVGTGMSVLVPQSIEYLPAIRSFGADSMRQKKMSVQELALILSTSFPTLQYGLALETAREIQRTLSIGS